MKNTEVTEEKILDLYSKYVLRHNKMPTNIYVFCEDNDIPENEFYFYYANFEQLEPDYLKFFMRQTLQLISEEINFNEETARHKLLSFYYTFFEQLNLNRSLIIYLIGSEKNNLRNLKKMWSLKKEFQMFIRNLEISKPVIEGPDEKMQKLDEIKNKGIEELFWGHFLTTIKFWLEDTSSSFEKTDIFIEKSVDTSFELLDTKPLRKLLDLGKFLFNEKVKNK